MGAPQIDADLLRLTPSAVIAIDAEGRITLLNAHAERLLGVREADVAGDGYIDVLGRSLADRVVGLFLLRGRGEAQLLEARLPNGRRARLRATAGPLHDAAGRAAGVLVVAEDRSAEADAEQRIDRERAMRAALRRYVGGAVADLVEARPSFVGVRGVRQTISVLHADVRGYTTLAESLDPERVMSLLVRFHSAAVGVLRDAGACIDRFAGDAILALWNAPTPQDHHERLALQGALAMQDAVSRHGDELRYGVGVHTGEAVVGNLGDDAYVNYTAIGDTVNVAARLQGHARAGEVVCSSTILEKAGTGVRAIALGALELKGRRAKVDAYRVESAP